MEPVFAALEIDYYVVGAVARDIHLSADLNSAALRKTNDVDLAILVIVHSFNSCHSSHELMERHAEGLNDRYAR